MIDTGKVTALWVAAMPFLTAWVLVILARRRTGLWRLDFCKTNETKIEGSEEHEEATEPNHAQ